MIKILAMPTEIDTQFTYSLLTHRDCYIKWFKMNRHRRLHLPVSKKERDREREMGTGLHCVAIYAVHDFWCVSCLATKSKLTRNATMMF